MKRSRACSNLSALEREAEDLTDSVGPGLSNNLPSSSTHSLASGSNGSGIFLRAAKRTRKMSLTWNNWIPTIQNKLSQSQRRLGSIGLDGQGLRKSTALNPQNLASTPSSQNSALGSSISASTADALSAPIVSCQICLSYIDVSILNGFEQDTVQSNHPRNSFAVCLKCARSEECHFGLPIEEVASELDRLSVSSVPVTYPAFDFESSCTPPQAMFLCSAFPEIGMSPSHKTFTMGVVKDRHNSPARGPQLSRRQRMSHPGPSVNGCNARCVPAATNRSCYGHAHKPAEYSGLQWEFPTPAELFSPASSEESFSSHMASGRPSDGYFNPIPTSAISFATTSSGLVFSGGVRRGVAMTE